MAIDRGEIYKALRFLKCAKAYKGSRLEAYLIAEANLLIGDIKKAYAFVFVSASAQRDRKTRDLFIQIVNRLWTVRQKHDVFSFLHIPQKSLDIGKEKSQILLSLIENQALTTEMLDAYWILSRTDQNELLAEENTPLVF